MPEKSILKSFYEFHAKIIINFEVQIINNRDMDSKIRTIIIEDEEPARDLLKLFLGDFDNIELIDSCSDGFIGLKAINEHKPDLVIMDIQMPKLTGFEVLELLDDIPEIIFSTAYDQYAIKAFEMNAVDYLMKPFSKARFRQAIEKAVNRINNKESHQTQLKQLSEKQHNESGEINRIIVKNGSQINIIPLDDIQQIEAEDDYVMIYTSNDRYLKKETLNYLEEHLPCDKFIRVHRSSIIHINQIEKIEQYGKENYLLILKNGNQVKVSKSRIKDLKKELDF